MRMVLLGFIFIKYIPRSLGRYDVLSVLLLVPFLGIGIIYYFTNDISYTSFYLSLKVHLVLLISILLPYYINNDEASDLLKFITNLYALNII